jgi:hypothetical protein
MQRRVERWRSSQLSDEQAKLVLYALAWNDAMIGLESRSLGTEDRRRREAVELIPKALA